MFKDMYKFMKKHDLDLVKANYYEHSDAGDVFQEPFAGFAYKTVFVLGLIGARLPCCPSSGRRSTAAR